MVTLNPVTNEKENEKYWEEFYKKFNLDQESTFCKYVKGMIDYQTQIIDLGCGSGRDTRSFSKDGYTVLGIDRSFEAIKNNINSLTEIGEINNIKFKTLDISEKENLIRTFELVNREAKKEKKRLLVYTRFFLHSITQENEIILFNTLENTLQKNDMFAAEFRTIEDSVRSKVFDNHYRRYINSDELVKKIKSNYSFKVKEYTKGTGLSLFNGEDPHLARIIIEKL